MAKENGLMLNEQNKDKKAREINKKKRRETLMTQAKESATSREKIK